MKRRSVPSAAMLRKTRRKCRQLVSVAGIRIGLVGSFRLPMLRNWIEIGVAPGANVLRHGLRAVNPWPKIRGLRWHGILVATMTSTIPSAATATATPATAMTPHAAEQARCRLRTPANIIWAGARCTNDVLRLCWAAGSQQCQHGDHQYYHQAHRSLPFVPGSRDRSGNIRKIGKFVPCGLGQKANPPVRLRPSRARNCSSANSFLQCCVEANFAATANLGYQRKPDHQAT